MPNMLTNAVASARERELANPSTYRGISRQMVDQRLLMGDANTSASRMRSFSAAEEYGGYAPEYGGDYQVEDFDPSSYISETAGSVYNDLSERFGQDVTRLNARKNARGMYNSGVGNAGVTRDFSTRLASAIAGIGMQAAQMKMGDRNFQASNAFRNRDMRMSYDRMGQDRLSESARLQMGLYDRDREASDRMFDAKIGLTASDLQQRAADRASKRSMWGSIAQGIGTIGGAVLGGPIGGAIANKVIGKAVN